FQACHYVIPLMGWSFSTLAGIYLLSKFYTATLYYGDNTLSRIVINPGQHFVFAYQESAR
ncbi:MAG: hypothetical protein ABW100_11215, partial [Candidatus Thiodiazotropha sp. 6PLUC3]